LDAVVDRIPPPSFSELEDKTESEIEEMPMKAFLFDTRFVQDRGVACLIKIMGGSALDVHTIRNIISYHTSKRYDVYEVGVVQPNMTPTEYLRPGQVGYFLSNLKSVAEASIGDTFFDDKARKEDINPFPGYE